MIERSSLKRAVAYVVLLVGVAIAIGSIVLATFVVSRSSTGANGSSALHEVAELPAEADRLVTWDKDDWKQDRVLEPDTRIAVEAAYIRAWAALGVYQSTGASAALVATFSGPARANALGMPRDDQTATWSVSHRLRLEFYALDGATIALTDMDARLVRTIGPAGAETVVDSDERYSVVMVLEDGYWRVRQLRREVPASVETVSRSGSGVTLLTGQHAIAPVAGPASLKATDYPVPGGAEPSARTFAIDLRRVRALGLDTVRVRWPYVPFTGSAADEARLASLASLLETARAARLRVVLVLFDGLSDLSPAIWASADQYVEQLTQAVGANPALEMWDIADRPDRRRARATATEIRAFVVHEAELLHRLTATVPVTVSWADPAAAADRALASMVDVVSLHPTDGLGDLGSLNRVREAAGRPVMLVVSTSGTDGGWSPVPRTEHLQSVQLARAFQVSGTLSIDKIAVDALQDHGPQRDGLLRGDGSAKPGAAIVRTSGAGTVASFEIGDYLGSKFWRAAALALVIVVIGWLRLGRSRRSGRRSAAHPSYPARSADPL